jgi:hypothetical protein
MSWLSPTVPGHWWTAQPVAHVIGGTLWALFGMLLWWPHGGWRPVAFAGGMTLYWELRVWEPQPDGTYPFRWLVYDVLTALVASTVVTLVWRAS